MKPAFNNETFKNYKEGLKSETFNKLIDAITELNGEIEKDETLGEGFQIGHSFFCNLESDSLEEELRRIIRFNIIPLLKEYWFDDAKKVSDWKKRL